MRHGAQTAADVELKTASLFAVYRLYHPDAAHVVHIGQAAGLVLAAGEGDLEFATEILAVGMAEQKAHDGFGIGGDIEGLGAADP